MDISAIAAAAAELREAVRGDGVDLRLATIDVRNDTVAFRLDLESAGCADCVLAPAPLRDMVDSALHRRVPGDYRVLVEDPREDDGAGSPPVSAGSGGPLSSGGTDPGGPPAGGWLTVVDPTATTAVDDPDPGPDAGPLAGRRIGFRVDVLWRSWDWVVDEWSAGLRERGAEVVLFRRTQGLDGAAGRRQDEEYSAFLSDLDAAVSGLGNCGSCTSWTIKDAVSALHRGLPTVGVTTAHFEQLGRTLAGHYGRSGLRLHVLPYPLDVRPEDEVRAIARDHLPGLLERLGVPSVVAVS